MVKEEQVLPDGADEEMLGAGGAEEKLAERRDEVKFIKGDHQNGEAKIDIRNLNSEKPVRFIKYTWSNMIARQGDHITRVYDYSELFP